MPSQFVFNVNDKISIYLLYVYTRAICYIQLFVFLCIFVSKSTETIKNQNESMDISHLATVHIILFFLILLVKQCDISI